MSPCLKIVIQICSTLQQQQLYWKLPSFTNDFHEKYFLPSLHDTIQIPNQSIQGWDWETILLFQDRLTILKVMASKKVILTKSILLCLLSVLKVSRWRVQQYPE